MFDIYLFFLCPSLVVQSKSAVLKDRLYHAQGLTSEPRPEFPFAQVEFRPQARVSEVTTSAPAVMEVSGNSNMAQFMGQVSEPEVAPGNTGSIRGNIPPSHILNPQYGGHFNAPGGGSMPGSFPITNSRPGDAVGTPPPSTIHTTPITSDPYASIPNQVGASVFMTRQRAPLSLWMLRMSMYNWAVLLLSCWGDFSVWLWCYCTEQFMQVFTLYLVLYAIVCGDQSVDISRS